MDAPWSDAKTLKIKEPLDRLSAEIEDFCKYIAPLSEEKHDRKHALQDVIDVIHSRWANAKIVPFGSYVTGLQLPNSDIDITINLPIEKRSCLKQVRSLILGRGICRFNDTDFVPFAKVPVLAIKDIRRGVEIDITVNNVVTSSDRTLTWVKEYPDLKTLFIVLKHALSSIRFVNVPMFEVLSPKKEGLASYALICLIVSYLHLEKHSQPKPTTPVYYAKLLQGFLQFYSKFDFAEKAITFKNGGGYLKKGAFPSGPCRRTDVIVIEDPDHEGVNVARSARNIRLVQLAFCALSDWLTDSLCDNHRGSILSTIIVTSSPRPRHGKSYAEKRPIGENYVLGWLDVRERSSNNRKRRNSSEEDAYHKKRVRQKTNTSRR